MSASSPGSWPGVTSESWCRLGSGGIVVRVPYRASGPGVEKKIVASVAPVAPNAS
jgi:hypothetical protein